MSEPPPTDTPYDAANAHPHTPYPPLHRTGGIVPFSTALPMLLRLLASSPPPYVLNAYPRMARHVRQLEASTGQLALAVQAGEPGEPGTPRGSGADAALVAAFRQAGTAVHACASSAEADVGLARDAMAAAGIALRCSD